MKRLLGLICLVLAAVIAWQWRTWPLPRGGLTANSAEEAEELRTSPPTETRLSLIPPINKDEYASVIDRPLFLSSRRPPEEEVPAEIVGSEVPGLETPLENFDLNAVIITPSGAIAWVTTPTEPKPQKVQIGDDLEGWKVKNISNDEIEMEGQSGSDRLVLRNFSQSGQPVPKLPPRVESRNRPTPPTSRKPVSREQREQTHSPASSKAKPPSTPRPNPARRDQ